MRRGAAGAVPVGPPGATTYSSGMAVSGLRQVAQHVEDLDRAVAFYRDVVGLDLIARFDPPGIAFFDLGGTRLLLEPGAPSALLYLGVANIDGQIYRTDMNIWRTIRGGSGGDATLGPFNLDGSIDNLDQALLREFEGDGQGTWPGTQSYRLLIMAFPDAEPSPSAPATALPPPPAPFTPPADEP